MTFEIEAGGRTRSIAIDPLRDRCFRVVVDGRPRLVDACRLDASTVSLLFIDEDGAGGSAHEVTLVEAGGPGRLIARLRNGLVTLTVDGGRARRSRGAAAPVGRAGAVVAPMAGRVVRVLVAPGDEVVARQPLVVVEAMKMENELLAPRAGWVIEVAAQAGMSVEAGRVLVRVGDRAGES